MSITNNGNEKDLTEGESIIAEYFSDEAIKHNTNYKIFNLKGDSKSYREADFYLPEFGLYVEFFGGWNKNEEEKARYWEKKKLYEVNKIPCVYLYPENLGILKYIFNMRARTALKKYGTKKGQLRFGWYLFNFNIRLEFAVIILSSVYLLHRYGLFDPLHYLIFDIFIVIILIAASYDLVRALILKFKHNKE